MNLGNVVGDKAVRLPVNRDSSSFAGGVHQAEDRAGTVVEPVLEVVNPVLGLYLQVPLVCGTVLRLPAGFGIHARPGKGFPHATSSS